MRHEYVYPDCPKCGKEMHQYKQYGAKTPEYPVYGKPSYWFQCDKCFIKTPARESCGEALNAALDFVKGGAQA